MRTDARALVTAAYEADPQGDHPAGVPTYGLLADIANEALARLAVAERVVEIARSLGTCNLDPCEPCICDHHPWTSPVDHEATCDDLRGEIAEFDRLQKAYSANREGE